MGPFLTKAVGLVICVMVLGLIAIRGKPNGSSLLDTSSAGAGMQFAPKPVGALLHRLALKSCASLRGCCRKGSNRTLMGDLVFTSSN